MAAALSFDQLERLAPRLGTNDAPCPICSAQVSPQGARRKVLRIWRERDDFAGFACARCGEKGWARNRDAEPRSRSSAKPPPERLAEIRREAVQRQAIEQAQSLGKARWLWARRRPVGGSPAETYLREGRGYRGPIPATLGYLPANGDYGQATIGAFGIASEPEPGVLAIADDAVVGVHITKLSADGSGKADVEPNKIMVGRGSSGFPICVAPPNDMLGLAITEGIEDALSIRQATSLGAWAAGSASRVPALANTVPSYIECVTVCAHPEPTGQENASSLAEALTARGIEVIPHGFSS
jgi:hypothetical protein